MYGFSWVSWKPPGPLATVFHYISFFFVPRFWVLIHSNILSFYKVKISIIWIKPLIDPFVGLIAEYPTLFIERFIKFNKVTFSSSQCGLRFRTINFIDLCDGNSEFMNTCKVSRIARFTISRPTRLHESPIDVNQRTYPPPRSFSISMNSWDSKCSFNRILRIVVLTAGPGPASWENNVYLNLPAYI